MGLSEVERRAQYLNIIGRPSEEQEGHPLMPLIEHCLNNSPNLRPTSSELVERMSDAVTQQPLTFSNRVDMMQRMESILTEKETLQTRVSVLEGQVERGEVARREQREKSQRQEAALSVEVEQLRLQVGNLEAEKTHLSTTATAREELHRTEIKAKESQHQAEVATMELQQQAELHELQGKLDSKERQHQTEAAAKERQHEAEMKEKDDQLQAKSTELSSQSSLLSQQRSTIEGLYLQLQQARQTLISGTQVSSFMHIQ
jgi:chromosome segregation ATPase